MNYRTLIFFLVLLCCKQATVFSQSIFKKYLSESSSLKPSGTEDQLTRMMQESSSPSQSFVERFEFRSSTSDFRLDQQQYSFRIGFNPLFQNKQLSRIYLNNISLLKNKFGYLQSQEVYTKYLEILEFITLTQKHEIAKRKYQTLQNLLKICHEKMTQLRNPLLSIAKLEIQQSELQNTLMNIEEKRKPLGVLFQFNSGINKEDSLTLPEPTDILNYVSRSTTEFSPLDFELKKDRAEAKYQLKRAEDKKILDFVQLRYNSDPNDLFREKASVGLGLKIPYEIISNSRRQDLQLELMELQIENEAEAREFYTEVKYLREDLIRQIHDAINRNSDVFNLRNKYDFTKLAEVLKEDPEQLTDLALELYKMEEDQINKSYDLYVTYLKYLFKAGILYHFPDFYYLKYPLEKL